MEKTFNFGNVEVSATQNGYHYSYTVVIGNKVVNQSYGHGLNPFFQEDRSWVRGAAKEASDRKHALSALKAELACLKESFCDDAEDAECYDLASLCADALSALN